MNGNSPARSQTGLIFLHIWKAGGSTLHDIIERQYPDDTIYSIDGSRYEASMSEFKQLPESDRAELRVVKGHMDFGLHEYLPRPCTYITMLREPLNRVISDYYYIMETPTHNFYEFMTARKMTLDEFASTPESPLFDNVQTRVLSGLSWSVPYGECTDDMLELAKQNIETYFTVVGLTEQFDKTLILLQKELGWRNIAYVKKNVTKTRAKKSDVPKETIDLIKQYNRLDVELYRYAKERFEKQLDDRVPDIKRELDRLKVLNQLYKPYHLYQRAIGKVKSLVMGNSNEQ